MLATDCAASAAGYGMPTTCNANAGARWWLGARGSRLGGQKRLTASNFRGRESAGKEARRRVHAAALLRNARRRRLRLCICASVRLYVCVCICARGAGVGRREATSIARLPRPRGVCGGARGHAEGEGEADAATEAGGLEAGVDGRKQPRGACVRVGVSAHTRTDARSQLRRRGWEMRSPVLPRGQRGEKAGAAGR